MADLTEHGLASLANAVRMLRTSDVKRIDLGHDTIIYKVPTGNPKKYTIRVDMKFDESEDE